MIEPINATEMLMYSTARITVSTEMPGRPSSALDFSISFLYCATMIELARTG